MEATTSFSLKIQDLQSQLSSLHNTHLDLTKEIGSTSISIDELSSSLQIECQSKSHLHTLNQTAKKSIITLRQQVEAGHILRECELAVVEEEVKKQEDLFLALDSQKKRRRLVVNDLQKLLEQEKEREQASLQHSEKIEGIYNKQVVNLQRNMGLMQEVSTNTFETKVSLTEYGSRRAEIHRKVQLLRECKGQLIELVTLF